MRSILIVLLFAVVIFVGVAFVTMTGSSSATVVAPTQGGVILPVVPAASEISAAPTQGISVDQAKHLSPPPVALTPVVVVGTKKVITKHIDHCSYPVSPTIEVLEHHFHNQQLHDQVNSSITVTCR